jgi:PAS domain S-box-containing protein
LADTLHVLLVEDNADYLAFVTDALSVSDGSVRTTPVSSLRDARARLATGGIDVVLLDLSLPDSSGLDTLQRLQDVAHGAPIVVLSGRLDAALATAAMQAGAQDYLVKSDVTPQVIARVMRYAVERRAAEMRLHERDASYRSIIESSFDAVISTGVAGVTEFNAAAEAMFGRRRADVLGKDLATLIVPERLRAAHREGLRRHLADPAAAITRQRLELTGVRADGHEFPIELTLSKQQSADGPICTAFIRDLSERKELERRVLRAQRMESIGTLAGGIAHDLNNMLAPVLMSIELLKETESGEEREQILATVEASARRGAAMVRQVLSFARGVEGDRAPVDVAGLLQEVEKFANDTFMKSIRVRTETTGAVNVLGDATQLHQVLINLCVNARDAMPNGGTLTLSARSEPVAAGQHDVDRAIAPGNYVVIRVTDTGTGIQPAVFDRIFEPFFTSKATGKGTGLGLSTSLAIVKSHGGFMRAETTVGSGSTFSVYLPALAALATRAPAAVKHAPNRGAGELILVVDDESAVLRMTTLVLESFGYRVLATDSGQQAVRLFETHRGEIKVLFTDMTMPGIDGATLIRRVREIDPGVRVIAASGLGAHEAAKVPGVMRFLAKPYTADSVLKAVTEALAR